MFRTRLYRTALAAALPAALLGLTPAALAASLDPTLEALIADGQFDAAREVIVTFDGNGPLTSAQRDRLLALGLNGITLESLPMAGVVATQAQVLQLDRWDDVRSIWLNAELQYENHEATELTGVDRLRRDPALRKNGMPISGRGVAVLVNDSGIDGTHPDLTFPRHVVQNVAAQTNLRSVSGLLPVTRTENVPNTDIAGGHGTHVAGIVGATGAASPGGKFEGVAPGADLVGYGSGAGLLILDTLGGFDYALSQQSRYNIRVVSNSFGQTSDTGTDFNPDHPTNVATKALADRGVVVVFSAGNAGPGEGTITGQFKKAPWVITVAAGDKQGGLASFSSRGENGRGGEVVVDGEVLRWEDRPTVTAPGANIYSTRAAGGPLDALSLQSEIGEIGAADAVYYSRKSGTSMSAPHVSGIVALMLQANPSLDWRGVKQILQETSTNLTGRAPWEAGAGYVNAHAAVQAAFDLGAFGQTVNARRTFNARAMTSVASNEQVSVPFSPVGNAGSVSFHVPAGVTLVNANANVSDNTVALVLTDPNGKRYGSGVSLPVLGPNIAVAAPGVPGSWTLSVRGIGGLSGASLDPAQLTNGYGVPDTVVARIKQIRTDGYVGLNDVDSHPARGFVEFGVSARLLDTDAQGRYRPDAKLLRAELADFLVMGMGVRQSDPIAGATFPDVDPLSPLYPFAEAVGGRGGVLRDAFQRQDPLLGADAQGRFGPTGTVRRDRLAYVLVQSLGLQDAARAHTGDVTVAFDGARYVLDAGLIPATFRLVQGPFDLQPTLQASFGPETEVSRADYAAAAARFALR